LAADAAVPVIGPAVLGMSGWALFWAGFLVAFPYSPRVRAVYLFNEKARGALSLWFVPVIMTLFPFLRRHTLRPFRGDLLADARLAVLDERQWYAGIRVEQADGTIVPILRAIPDIRGTVLLIGESGLGKSTYLRVLAKHSRRTIAFLNARSCDKGVEEAIVQRVIGFQSADFFRALIYSRDLAVIIDGLNEVTAEARAGIVAFANRPGGADLLISTQPIEGIGTDRSPFVRATSYELQALPRQDIAAFLKSRPARKDAASRVHMDAYDRAVDRLLSETLDDAPTDEERQAAELILSNPMDLTYASELIALGQMPQPSQMIDQAFRLARARYRGIYDRDFPTLAFAHKAVELRKEDRNWLKADEFLNEQATLQDLKLLVPRPMLETVEKPVTVLRFRHDKVMDVLMKPAFDVDEELQLNLIDDPRFRGVYLLYAQDEDQDTARGLRDLLVSRAAQTRDHTLSDEFVRRFNLRGPKTPDGPRNVGSGRAV
jgi:hypothetical protein